MPADLIIDVPEATVRPRIPWLEFDRAIEAGDRFVEMSGAVKNSSVGGLDLRRQRVHFRGNVDMLDRLWQAPECHQQERIDVVRIETIGVYVDCVEFNFSAVQRTGSGDADGNFHFASSPEGKALDIHGYITCMTTDPANPGRAWMGGVITKNESEHPTFVGDTKEVGDDAWFRVVDYGEGGSAQPDRTTNIFFEPTGNFHSAREFCDSLLWFPDDRVTNPLLDGNIQVKE